MLVNRTYTIWEEEASRQCEPAGPTRESGEEKPDAGQFAQGELPRLVKS